MTHPPVNLAVSGRTRVAAVIGDPVAHSLSPLLHNAGYAALGLDWVYVALPVPSGRGTDAVRALSVLGLAGLNVTYPHKAAAAAGCDELTTTARALGSVNTVTRRDDGSWLGCSTDGDGMLAALAEESVRVEDARAVVLGAGGAARAITEALGRHGAAVTVVARRRDAAEAGAALAPGAVGIDLDDEAGLRRVLADATLVVQATPVGMTSAEIASGASVVPAEWIGPDAFVAETIYSPDETAFLEAVRRRGRRGMNGVGMLVHQAARSFELLTGHPVDPAVLRAALPAKP